MPSLTLYSRFCDKRVMQPLVPENYANPKLREAATKSIESMILNAVECKLIRIDEVLRDLTSFAMQTGFYFNGDEEWLSLPPIAVPFEWIWMECCTPGGSRRAVLCHRETLNGGGFALTMMAGCEAANFPSNIIFPILMVTVVTDAAGQILSRDGYGNFLDDSVESHKIMYDMCHATTFAAVHAFARLNCKNVELRAPIEVTNQKKRLQTVRKSVWHEIVVSEVNRQSVKSKTDQPKDIRSHWVRGHFADYRSGSGLFGKIHGVFWMPEHERGNPEIGTVKQSYRVC